MFRSLSLCVCFVISLRLYQCQCHYRSQIKSKRIQQAIISSFFARAFWAFLFVKVYFVVFLSVYWRPSVCVYVYINDIELSNEQANGCDNILLINYIYKTICLAIINFMLKFDVWWFFVLFVIEFRLLFLFARFSYIFYISIGLSSVT